jgi:hypothetical protein
MSIVVLSLFALTTVVALGLLTTMYVKDEPWYGAMGLFLLLGPVSVLSFTCLAVAPN